MGEGRHIDYQSSKVDTSITDLRRSTHRSPTSTHRDIDLRRASHDRVLSRKIILGGKLVLRAVLVAPGGGCGRGVCSLPCEAWKLSPF